VTSNRLSISRCLSLAAYAALVWIACCGTASAEKAVTKARPAMELGAPFADNAVLQRQMAVPVWGWSRPGTKITVEFAGQNKSATAGKDGKWMLKLDPLKANATPAEMVISDNAGGAVTLRNILVGEVWMCSGQSNMQLIASKCAVGRVLMKQIAERVAAGKEKPPIIREGKVTNVASALHPIERAEGAWSTDAGNFSGIAYAFAYELYRELRVPIGIVNCAFSTTSIEAWIPRVGFKDGTDAYTRSVYQKILESDPTTPEHKAAWAKFYQGVEDGIRENDRRIKKGQAPKAISLKTPGNLRGNRDASWMFNGKINPMVPYAIRGAIWNQGYASSGGGLTYYYNLHSMIRGWRKVWNRPDLPVYFHQFYSPGHSDGLSLNSTAEMRLGTWLARDIPNADMASQIDISGSVHYFNKAVPGRRLALHALKNQYPSTQLRAGGKAADIVADGAMFKSYKVEGAKLIVTFDHAEGGLLVAETGTRAKKGLAIPTVIPNGDDKVTLFYIADAKRVWHRAKMEIDGEKVVLTAPGVKAPRGVAYGCNGVGFQPNVYNKALLPTTPFIYYDHKLVTRESWPDKPIKVAGVTPDPGTTGRRYEYRKMPILSTQFRENAVLQAGVPVTIWGSTRLFGEWGGAAEDKEVIHFSFAGIEKAIPVTPDMLDWRVTLPPMPASAEPKTLKVSCTIDGELAHERVIKGIVFGDVWYVAAPSMKLQLPAVKPSGRIVRMMTRKAKRWSSASPSRYSVAISRTPLNRFASVWTGASGLAGAIGHRIAAKTGKPVGIIFMRNGLAKGGMNPELKDWIPTEVLNQAPSLKEDYRIVGCKYPGNPYYNANIRRHIADWKKYWGEYIPEMMATKAVPDGSAWGRYPVPTSGAGTSSASGIYNVMVHSFTPAALKGVVFLCSDRMVEKDQGANYGSELSVLANSWKDRFGGKDMSFVYTLPGKGLAPKITRPTKIKGKSTAVEIDDWSEVAKVIDTVVKETCK